MGAKWITYQAGQLEIVPEIPFKMVKKPSPHSSANRPAPVASDVPLTPFFEMSQSHSPLFREWMADFFAKLPQGVILTGQDGRVVIFNEAAGSFLGYKPEEVVGRLFLWELCKPLPNGQPPAFRVRPRKRQQFPGRRGRDASQGRAARKLQGAGVRPLRARGRTAGGFRKPGQPGGIQGRRAGAPDYGPQGFHRQNSSALATK